MEETAKKDVELLKTLRTPEFAEFFNKKIEPSLLEVENLRNKFVSAYFTAIVLSAVIAAGIYFLFKNYSGIIVALLIIVAVLNYVRCVYSLNAKSKILSKLLSFWGEFSGETPNVKDLMWKRMAEAIWDYTDTGIYSQRETEHSYFDNNDYIANPHGQYAKSLNIFPDFNRCEAYEVFKGQYKDIDLVIRSMLFNRVSFSKKYIELGAIRLGRRYIKKIFNGLLITSGVKKEFSGRIIIKNKKNRMNKFGYPEFPPQVSIENEIFEDIFEIYADDIEQVKKLLTVPFMQRLIFIAKQKGKFDILCLFENGLMNLAMQKRGKWFDVSMFKSANTIKNFKKMLMDTGKILTIIDSLHDEAEIETEQAKESKDKIETDNAD